jgi:hypothetical protein
MVAARLKHSSQKELRYVHNTKTGKVHVGDAAHHNHSDIADHMGEHEFTREFPGEPTHYNLKHFHAGFISHHNIDKIKAHPKGLKGHIEDIHKGLPDANSSDWDDPIDHSGNLKPRPTWNGSKYE